MQVLDVGAKQRLDILFRIMDDLLELVKSDITGFPGLLQVVENLLQRARLRALGKIQPDLGLTCYLVHGQIRAQALDY